MVEVMNARDIRAIVVTTVNVVVLAARGAVGMVVYVMDLVGCRSLLNLVLDFMVVRCARGSGPVLLMRRYVNDVDDRESLATCTGLTWGTASSQ